uniref:AP complex mu/sigma subunit domain-containing protein n=1 Tax=Salmo trutta TaxID=8032 RepID=A0A673WW67_SALTR
MIHGVGCLSFPQNELSHNFVEVLDKYFSHVVSSDGMQLQSVVFLKEVVQPGETLETNKNRILAPLLALDQMSETH